MHLDASAVLAVAENPGTTSRRSSAGPGRRSAPRTPSAGRRASRPGRAPAGGHDPRRESRKRAPAGIGGQSNWFFAPLRPDERAPSAQVLSPNGSSPLLSSTQRHLGWSVTDGLAIQSVDPHLSGTGLSGPLELLAAAAPKTGSHMWAVTGPEMPGNDAYLLVAARDHGGNLGLASPIVGSSSQAAWWMRARAARSPHSRSLRLL